MRDGVIVINAEKIVVTGIRSAKRVYPLYSSWAVSQNPLQNSDGKKLTYFEHAVKAMMPKTRLANAQYKRLRVYAVPNTAWQLKSQSTQLFKFYE